MSLHALYADPRPSLPDQSHACTFYRWFAHFYAWAVAWDLVVLVHIVMVLLMRKPAGLPFIGRILSAITSLDITPPQSGGAPMQCTRTEWEVLAGMCLLLFQSSRRLYESLFIMNSSQQAKMHLSHYLLAYLFYTLRASTVVLHLRQGGRQTECIPPRVLLPLIPHLYVEYT